MGLGKIIEANKKAEVRSDIDLKIKF